MNFNRNKSALSFETPPETPLVYNPNHIRAAGAFFNAFHFWVHLADEYDAVDATAFTYDADFCRSLPLRRVVCNKTRGAAANLHAKLFLCYRRGKLRAAFAGSWNLVRPTWLEVVVKLPQQAERAAEVWFDDVWRQAKPVKTDKKLKRSKCLF